MSGRLNPVTGVLSYPALPTPKRPHRCPICNGKGTVPAGFYDHGPAGSNTTNPLTCKACGGNGIVIA